MADVAESREPDTDAAPPRNAKSQARTLLLKLAVTGAGLAFLALTTDLGAAAGAIAGAAPHWALLSIGLLSGCLVFAAWRWQRLLACDGARIGGVELLLVYLESSFFGLLLPSSLGGDVFRAWRIRVAVGGTRRAVINLLVERIVGMSAVGLVALAALALRPPLGSATAAALAVVAVLVIGGSVILLTPSVARIACRLAERLRLARLAALLARTAEQIAGYRRDRGALPAVFVLSVVQHMVAAAGLWCAAAAVGATIDPGIALASIPIVVLLSLFPSIAGIGPREVGLAYVLSHAGATEATAVATAALFLAGIVARGLIGGAIYLVRRGR